MTHSGPHNHSAATAELNSGAAPETEHLHPPEEGSASPPLGRVQNLNQDLTPVRQTLEDLRNTLISSGLDVSGSGGSGAEALLAQIPPLEAAVRELEALRDRAAQQAGSDGSGTLDFEQIARQLVALQTEIARSQHLIQRGTEFWLGWAGLLGLDTGYTAMGMIAPLTGIPEAGNGRKVSLNG